VGSSSRSKTSSTESSQTLADNRVVDGDNAIIGGNITLSNTGSGSGQFNVTTTDFGALDAASELSGRALTSVDNSVAAVRTIAGDAGATISGALAKVTDFAASQQPDQKEAKTLQLIVIAVAVVGVVYVYRGGR
jgi:hypothetical protein